MELLKDGYLHMRHVMAWLVEVVSGCFIQCLVSYITSVLGKPLRQGLLCLADVLFLSLATA